MKLNKLASSLARAKAILPSSLHPFITSFAFNSMVKMSGTARQHFSNLTQSEAVVTISNIRRNQNHIGGVHAAGMALVAETATGAVFGMNVTDSSLPLLKSMEVSYKRRSVGAITARATLTEAQRAFIVESPKGELLVPVVVTDESGAEPCVATMTWAWVPKKRSQNRSTDPAESQAASFDTSESAK
eukprot:TRINITY_DN59856_c0_g1_i1.p1 TRINITY_DN59856_c0_g1~~TRINITY_DN59856_c0_g1_i1.p1  ORF type:complete len:187 (+),score=33.13 TRINITY_DN59856_c0_g1_i1:66-626(+)